MLQSLGIIFRHPCPYIYQQNGKVERTEALWILVYPLAKTSMQLNFWWEAFEFATYLLNLLPTHVLHNKSPFHMLFGRPHGYHILKIFGCACYPYLRPYHPYKLHFRTSQCVFLGYNRCYKGYRYLNSSGRFTFLAQLSLMKRNSLILRCSSSLHLHLFPYLHYLHLHILFLIFLLVFSYHHLVLLPLLGSLSLLLVHHLLMFLLLMVHLLL